jgi:hypothetical protein
MRNPSGVCAWLVCLSIVAAAALIPVAPASAVAARGPDLSVRSGNGGWVGTGVVNGAGGVRQRLDAPIQPSKTRDVVIELRNLGPKAMFLLTGAPATSDFAVSYVDGRHRDVTAGVTGAGERVQVGAGLRVFFHLRVTAAAGLDTGASIALWVGAQGVRSGIADLVNVVVTVAPLTVAATSTDGRIRCAATFPFRSLRAGYLTGVTIHLTNLTHRAIRVYDYGATLSVRSADGSYLWRTGPLGFFSGPPPSPQTLRPGHPRQLFLWDTKVRWSGPLQVRAICGDVKVRMPTVSLDVTSPGAPASVAAAIDKVVGVRGSPFQDCHPGPSGEPATGQISTPDGRSLPPLTVRCWANVTVQDGFDVVRLHMVSPDDAPSYKLSDRFRITPQPARDAPNFLAASWNFVVTSTSAHPYLTFEESKAFGTGPGEFSYWLRHGHWTSSDWAICGVESFTAGLTGNGFSLDFITGCTLSAGSRVGPRIRRVLLDPPQP